MKMPLDQGMHAWSGGRAPPVASVKMGARVDCKHLSSWQEFSVRVECRFSYNISIDLPERYPISRSHLVHRPSSDRADFHTPPAFCPAQPSLLPPSSSLRLDGLCSPSAQRHHRRLAVSMLLLALSLMCPSCSRGDSDPQDSPLPGR